MKTKPLLLSLMLSLSSIGLGAAEIVTFYDFTKSEVQGGLKNQITGQNAVGSTPLSKSGDCNYNPTAGGWTLGTGDFDGFWSGDIKTNKLTDWTLSLSFKSLGDPNVSSRPSGRFNSLFQLGTGASNTMKSSLYLGGYDAGIPKSIGVKFGNTYFEYQCGAALENTYLRGDHSYSMSFTNNKLSITVDGNDITNLLTATNSTAGKTLQQVANEFYGTNTNLALEKIGFASDNNGGGVTGGTITSLKLEGKVIPEPTTATLSLIGLGYFMTRRRRVNK